MIAVSVKNCNLHLQLWTKSVKYWNIYFKSGFFICKSMLFAYILHNFFEFCSIDSLSCLTKLENLKVLRLHDSIQGFSNPGKKLKSVNLMLMVTCTSVQTWPLVHVHTVTVCASIRLEKGKIWGVEQKMST